jgi:MshEN domain
MKELGSRQAIADRIQRVREGEPPARPPLARLLEEEGLTAREQIERALTEGERTGERLGEVLLRWQLVDERQLALVLARQWQLSFLDEHELAPEANALAMLPAEEARQIGAVPVHWKDEVLRVVVVEPTEDRLAQARARIPEELAFGVVTHGAFTRLLSQKELAAADPVAERFTDDAQPPAEEMPSDQRPGFEELLGSLDDETQQLSRLRGQIQQFADFVAGRDQTAARLEIQLAERDQRAAQLETELVTVRADREQDLRTINQLEAELQERERLLVLVDAKTQELVSALGARRGR